jgi:hypothetical protein
VEGDAESGETGGDEPACRPGQQDEELRDVPHQALADVEEDVRPLDQLRLEPLAPADAVLLEGADDECRVRQPELPSSFRARRLVTPPEPRRVDADRDPEHLRGCDARPEHELLHRTVRHLHPVELLVSAPDGLVARVELGMPRRVRPTVEIRDPEPVARALEREPDQGELARVEDGLVTHAGDPAFGTDLDSERARDSRDLGRVVGDRPEVAVPGDEQPRMSRPRLRPPADRKAPQGRADATDTCARSHGEIVSSPSVKKGRT